MKEQQLNSASRAPEATSSARMIYLDCSAGIAGDMLLAALLDVGASLDYVRAGLMRLPLTESWTLDLESTMRSGIAAQRAVVTVDGKPADATFDGTGGLHEHGQDHSHGHRHDRDHLHQHGHDLSHPHTHSHPHRPYAEIKRMLAAADLPERVRMRAQKVFAELAVAEATVHGTTPDEVHFHEVGSTDAIIDIVGCCLALEELDVHALEASPLHVGRGFVRAAHGRMPIPAPATMRLLEGIPSYQTDVMGELVTPTGAALVRGLCRRVGPMPMLEIRRVGHGAGAHERELPNMVRAMLADALPSDGFERDEVVELSANIDDMNPQLFGAVIDALHTQGALDAWVEPATMKKGRPGHILHVLSPAGEEHRFASEILRHTTSLGVRASRASRWMLTREWVEVDTSGGTVRVKIGRKAGEIWNLAPEYDDCLAAAEASGIPVKWIMDEARRLAADVPEGEYGSA